jgi:hypothetical protein
MHVARMQKTRNYFKFWLEHVKGRDHWIHLCFWIMGVRETGYLAVKLVQ